MPDGMRNLTSPQAKIVQFLFIHCAQFSGCAKGHENCQYSSETTENRAPKQSIAQGFRPTDEPPCIDWQNALLRHVRLLA
jgi:hypothetical protein